jgi:deoxyhypusine synthase
MSTHTLPILEFILKSYHHFNAAALKNALLDYHRHIRKGGKMFWAVAGAMSTARMGIYLEPAIRKGLIHGISVTGANLEESLLRLVAHSRYKSVMDYRYYHKEDDECLLNNGLSRVTDTAIPENEAFGKIKAMLIPHWQRAQENGQRKFWHEFFYDLITDPEIRSHYDGAPDECWLLAAAEMKLPLIVGGYADSSFGNVLAGQCYTGALTPSIVKSDIEYMVGFYDVYRNQLSAGSDAGFFQIGGGIAGDFPICVVPSLKQDLRMETKSWAYFCQISDSTTSYGSYSGATPNEKITWDKLTKDTPMHIIESDATIVVPLMLQALLESVDFPDDAERLIAAYYVH